MNTLYSLFHLMRADYLERTRRYRFLVTLVLIVFMAYAYVPSRNAGYITLSVDGARGLYNSAWLGYLVAILVGITMPALGFFLVKNAIARDTETGVGQILAATPLKRPAYMIGKWLSNLSVLAVMLAVTALATLVLQLVLGEDRQVQPLTLLMPLIWIVLPTLALVSAIALLFESLSWLCGGFGNIVYFFLCTVLTMASFMPVMVGLGEPALGDVLGIGRPLAAMLRATAETIPGLDAGNTSIGPVPNFLAGMPLQTFVWAGMTWSPLDVLARLQWIGVGFGIVLLASLFFQRFDPSRGRYREMSHSSAVETPGTAEVFPAEQSYNIHLSSVETARTRFPYVRALQAELRLIRKGLSRWWLVVAAGLFLAGMLVAPGIAMQYILPVTWLWPILAWSQLGARESQHQTESLVFSNVYPLRRQLPAAWLAGVVMTALTGGGAAINFLRNGETDALLTWTVAIFFIPSLAIALATWSGSSKLFEVIYLTIWYLGPMNQLLPALNFLSTSGTLQFFFLIVSLLLLGAAVVGRQRQLNK
jgi:ABC-type transport system involved in multi-copper enzyme maturation permease subunit